ncbi:MAG: sugar ABC transporter permease [Trueperaceae bacterium]
MSRYSRQSLTAYLFLLPAVAALATLVLFPIFDGLIMSFQRVMLSGEREFIGLGNYTSLFAQSRFWDNLLYSLIYLTGNLVLAVPLGYIAALLLTSELPGTRYFRTIFLFPWVMTPAVTALMFQSLVDPVSGPVTRLMQSLTGERTYFLIDPDLAMLTLVVHSAWRSFPLIMLFLAAGIAGIPKEIYSAASLDGANGWTMFRHITLPLTRVQLFIVVLVITAFTLQDAESVYALTGGGPGNSTEVVAVRLMKEAFRNLNLGLGAAISVVLLFAGGLVMLVYSRLIGEESTQ